MIPNEDKMFKQMLPGPNMHSKHITLPEPLKTNSRVGVDSTLSNKKRLCWVRPKPKFTFFIPRPSLWVSVTHRWNHRITWNNLLTRHCLQVVSVVQKRDYAITHRQTCSISRRFEIGVNTFELDLHAWTFVNTLNSVQGCDFQLHCHWTQNTILTFDSLLDV